RLPVAEGVGDPLPYLLSQSLQRAFQLIVRDGFRNAIKFVLQIDALEIEVDSLPAIARQVLGRDDDEAARGGPVVDHQPRHRIGGMFLGDGLDRRGEKRIDLTGGVLPTLVGNIPVHATTSSVLLLSDLHWFFSHRSTRTLPARAPPPRR